MRILLAHDYGTRSGGAEVMLTDLRAALRKRGHDVLLFTSRARPLPLPIEADATCFGTTTPFRRFVQAANPHAPYRLSRIIDEFRPDLIMMKMFATQLSPLVLPALANTPAVLSVINYNLICPLNTKTLPDGSPCGVQSGRACRHNGCMPWLGVARAAVQKRLTNLDVFDHVFSNSHWVAERLRSEGVRIDSVIHNGVAETGQRPPLEGPATVGYSGRLIPKKGVDLLLRAFSGVARRVAGSRLVIVGDGPERLRLQSLAQELGVADATVFTGHLDRSEMEQALAPCWVQVVPSIWEEPFGLVAAEGLMRGTAVVASRSGGLTEQIRDGEDGFLYCAGDVAELTEALLRLTADRELAERLGGAGREHALAEFTFDRHVDRLLRLFRQILDGSSSITVPQ